jgi:hypothetical protein
MVVSSVPIPGWNNEPPKHKKVRYPFSRDDYAPKLPWLGLWCGARQSGKTYSLVKLLIDGYERPGVMDPETGEECEQRVVLFSPTAHQPVWQTLKHLAEDDIHDTYSDEKLADVIEDIKECHEEYKRYRELCKIYEKWRAKGELALTPAELVELDRLDYSLPNKEDFRCTKKQIIFLLLDDCVGTSAYRNGRSYLNYIALKNRHIAGGVSIAFLVQNLRSVPKVLRTNCNLFCLFKYANSRIIAEDMYEEVSNACREEEFVELFEYATGEPHSFLLLDFTGPRERLFRKNFTEVLQLGPSPGV